MPVLEFDNCTLEYQIGDCLELMKDIPDKSIDMILCDLPYGTTDCSWDTIIPFEPLWEQYERIIKDKGAIVLTSSQPFTTKLINSNIKHFKYAWVWDKALSGNIFLAEWQPMKIHEDIIVFCYEQPKYYPQLIKQNKRKMKNNGMKESAIGDFKDYRGKTKTTLNPKTIIRFPNTDRKNITHPTQKPVELFEYLIKTYSVEGDVVMDNCLGSGTTLLACRKTGRNGIGFEINPDYEPIIRKRIMADTKTLWQFGGE